MRSLAAWVFTRLSDPLSKEREVMNSVTYNIPAGMVAAYRGRQVVVRSHDPAEIIQHLSDDDLDNVQYIQLLSPYVAPETLMLLANWGRDVRLDIVIRHPALEFPLLYNFSRLLDKHPIRASIAVKPGFAKAVRLALALKFAVKLEIEQPEPALIEEMAEVLDLYLHRPNVSQPVEYFHSIFLSLYQQEPATLWVVQEEDPEYFRFVTDDGVETVSPRFAGVDPKNKTIARSEESLEARPLEVIECDTCEFLKCCGGYFKWPNRNFSCEGVKTIFGTLNGAAVELRADLATYAALHGGASHDEKSFVGDLSSNK
ncbi:MAG: hypothetical protein ND866_17840 [Pyrinomonadaceae bacterium]|nr:hypothetical protein [Pyrinomonadaceae bacterium]